jgi:transposase InsO family protein
MKQAVAHLGIHGMVFTTPYRPEGHGKLEAFNRLCRSAFISEVKASSITTLDELNLAFRAWLDAYYNRRPHAETQQRPFDRWRAGAHRIVQVSGPADPDPGRTAPSHRPRSR